MSLDYLMRTNFDEKMNQLEMKELLFEFRSEYRQLDSKVIQLNREKDNLNKRIVEMKQIINSEQKQLSIIRNEYNKLKNHKLTFMERISGKIKKNK